MKWQTLLTSLLLTALVASTGVAQCSRRGGSPSAGSTGPSQQYTSAGANPHSTYSSANVYRQRAQQQTYRQPTAQAQQQRRNAARRSRRTSSSDASLATNSRSTSKQERLREANAKKALASAIKADLSGRRSKAEDYYRRVIRIVGSASELGSRAETALASLSSDRLAAGESTLLAFVE